MPKEKEDTNLFLKLSQVLGEVTKIPKTGWNDHFKYKYVTEADMSDHIRPLLAKHGIALLFGVEEVTDVTPTMTQVKCKVTISDGITEKEVFVFGRASDKGDKGIYKAMTGAVKYWLFKTFLVSTGDDPEQEEPSSNGNGLQRDYNESQRIRAQITGFTESSEFEAFVDANREAINANKYKRDIVADITAKRTQLKTAQ